MGREYKGQEDGWDPTVEPAPATAATQGLGGLDYPDPSLFTISQFGIRAVRRQVLTPHRFSEFVVGYKTSQAHEEWEGQYPKAQTYEGWLARYHDWDRLQIHGEVVEVSPITGEGPTDKPEPDPPEPLNPPDPPPDDPPDWVDESEYQRCELCGAYTEEGGTICLACRQE